MSFLGQSSIPPNASPFGGQPPPAAAATPATGSIFGGQPQNTSGSVFGTPTTAVTASNQPQQQPQIAQSIFGTPAQQPAEAQSIFGTPANPSAPAKIESAETSAPVSVFGQPVTSSTTSGTTGAVVGSNPFAKNTDSSTSVGMFGKKIEDQLDSSIYSVLNSISALDLEAFKAPLFEIGKIPEIPPPKELCVA